VVLIQEIFPVDIDIFHVFSMLNDYDRSVEIEISLKIILFYLLQLKVFFMKITDNLYLSMSGFNR
jgi:hypothetical protein